MYLAAVPRLYSSWDYRAFSLGVMGTIVQHVRRVDKVGLYQNAELAQQPFIILIMEQFHPFSVDSDILQFLP